jgi:GT2 family glycosyltransferase
VEPAGFFVKFSAIIVDYDSWPLTLGCVEALRKTGREDFEVIIVANGPGEPPELPSVASGVRVIHNPANAGFARACNQGIAASTGGLVALINPDTRVEKEFFDLVEAFFAENPEAGIAGPRVLDRDGRVQLSARKEIGLLSGVLGRTSLLTRLFPKSPLVKKHFPALGELMGPTSVDWVSGACMISRRSTLERVGGLDERFFMYFEDADLCRRARGEGWTVCYLPGVTVTHEAGGSTGDKPRAIWRLHKSAFLYHRKHNRHGPLQGYSLLVFAGLTVRALAKLAGSLIERPTAETRDS